MRHGTSRGSCALAPSTTSPSWWGWTCSGSSSCSCDCAWSHAPVGDREAAEPCALHLIGELVRNYPGITNPDVAGQVAHVLHATAIELGMLDQGRPAPGCRHGRTREDLALPRRLDAGLPGPNTYVGQLNLLRHEAVRKSAIRLLSDQPEVDVAETAAVPAARALPPPIPLREVLPWAVFAGVVLLTLLYLVGLDQGATSLFSGSMIHEFLHDGRHLLGFPCH